ncbi:MAG: DNA-3-methyladenine glycosylase 2 family protein [Nitrospirae bacterium]|nr:DNA-3-methyladenine glycosylase 2 family protein [Nitrospirota bacterium]
MALLTTTKRRGRAGARTSHAAAGRHLAKTDPVLHRLIASIGPCELRPRRHHFATLCDSIISQQLSTKVAEVIFDRFAGLYPGRRLTPQAVVRTALPRLRAAGLSRQKAGYLKDLAAGFLDGRVQPSRMARQSNEEIIEALISIHGIGRWTAEMFLIFSLNRPDVLPVDDLGIKKAIQRWYRLPALPIPKKIRAIGKAWHPYETVASWYLWRSLRLSE